MKKFLLSILSAALLLSPIVYGQVMAKKVELGPGETDSVDVLGPAELKINVDGGIMTMTIKYLPALGLHDRTFHIPAGTSIDFEQQPGIDCLHFENGGTGSATADVEVNKL